MWRSVQVGWLGSTDTDTVTTEPPWSFSSWTPVVESLGRLEAPGNQNRESWREMREGGNSRFCKGGGEREKEEVIEKRKERVGEEKKCLLTSLAGGRGASPHFSGPWWWRLGLMHGSWPGP